MQTHLGRIHLVIGLLALLAFVLTGQYMDRWHAHLDGMPDGPRLMYRSAHIYVLYGALINLALGAYMQPSMRQPARGLQWIGSLILLAVPLLLLVSFLVESANDPLRRPIAVAGIYLSLLGVALHVFSSRASSRD